MVVFAALVGAGLYFQVSNRYLQPVDVAVDSSLLTAAIGRIPPGFMGQSCRIAQERAVNFKTIFIVNEAQNQFRSPGPQSAALRNWGPWGIRLMAVVLGLLLCASVSKSYSVLTHEEIVDLVWTDELRTLLLQRFPALREEQIKEAHGYTYGGAVTQDLGYFKYILFQKKRSAGGHEGTYFQPLLDMPVSLRYPQLVYFPTRMRGLLGEPLRLTE